MLMSKSGIRMCNCMKIAICDDYPVFAQELKRNIEDICAKKDWILDSTVYTSPHTMLENNLSAVQVVFLDIDMPELNGLIAARELRKRYPDIILVFVTAFIEYAPAGYHVSAFRYLLKQQLGSSLPEVMDDIHQKLIESTEKIALKSKAGEIVVPLKDILYLEGTPNRMVLFHTTKTSQAIEVQGKLVDYEKLLDGKGFVRLQRSFIVNMAQISKISGYKVSLRNGEVLKASEITYKQVHATFLQWKGQHI